MLAGQHRAERLLENLGDLLEAQFSVMSQVQDLALHVRQLGHRLPQPQDGLSGLRIFNVSNPLMPSEMVFHQTPGAAQNVAVRNGLAYVADGQAGLRVINVIPSTPVEVDFLETPGEAQGISLVGDRAYVADGVQGVRIINVPESARALLQLAALAGLACVRRVAGRRQPASR